MNAEDKLEGMLLKCSSGGIDGAGRAGLVSRGGLVVMTLAERSLAGHPLLADDDEDDNDDNEDDSDDLSHDSLVAHDLVPPEQLMMQEMMKNGVGRGDEDEEGGDAVSRMFIINPKTLFIFDLLWSLF